MLGDRFFGPNGDGYSSSIGSHGRSKRSPKRGDYKDAESSSSDSRDLVSIARGDALPVMQEITYGEQRVSCILREVRLKRLRSFRCCSHVDSRVQGDRWRKFGPHEICW